MRIPSDAPVSHGPQHLRRSQPPSRAAARSFAEVHAAAHSTSPPVRTHTRGLVGALNAEWRQLTEDRRTRSAVASWGESVPALNGLRDLSAVVTAASVPTDRDVLSGLLLLARRGDSLAARTALQVMLGAAVRLAARTRSHAGGDVEESVARAVAATWQVVRSYPIERRTCRPADGISLDVLSALTRHVHGDNEIAAGLPADLVDQAEPDQPDVGELREAFWSLLWPGRRPACGDEQVIMLLAWGVRAGAVSVADAQLLLRLHSPDDREAGISCRELAGELGLGHAAVRQRASRATRRLASAVQSLVAPDSAAEAGRERAAA
jgi:hypothetical protein